MHMYVCENKEGKEQRWGLFLRLHPAFWKKFLTALELDQLASWHYYISVLKNQCICIFTQVGHVFTYQTFLHVQKNLYMCMCVGMCECVCVGVCAGVCMGVCVCVNLCMYTRGEGHLRYPAV